MSAKPYFDEEVEAARAHLATVSQLDAKSGDTIAVCRDIERRWLATVDALKARLAAAESDAARARGLLVEASGWMKAECYSLHHRRNQYHASDEACPVEALQSELLARIDAHLASRPEGEVLGAKPVRCWDRDLCCGDDLCKFQNGETLPPNTYCGHDDEKEVRDGR